MNRFFYPFTNPCVSRDLFYDPFMDSYPNYSNSMFNNSSPDSKESLPEFEHSLTVIVLMMLFAFVAFFFSSTGSEIISRIVSAIGF